MDTRTTLQNTTAVIYARTASRRGTSKQPQIPALETLAMSLGYDVIATFTDWDANGDAIERVGLQNLFSYIEQRTVSYVLLSDVGRLARAPHVLNRILDRLSPTGVQIITLDGSRVEDRGRLFKELALPT
jgi:DNA invertase Pin-like site-specific DNA recombinase